MPESVGKAQRAALRAEAGPLGVWLMEVDSSKICHFGYAICELGAMLFVRDS
jgi:hypothetical protein